MNHRYSYFSSVAQLIAAFSFRFSFTKVSFFLCPFEGRIRFSFSAGTLGRYAINFVKTASRLSDRFMLKRLPLVHLDLLK